MAKPRVRLVVDNDEEKPSKKPQVSMRLSERTMLVDLDIGMWSARKKDERVSEEAREREGAEREAGSFQKNLLARRALKALGQASAKLTKVHTSMTLPWATSGARILKAEAYEKYAREIRLGRAAFDKAADDFSASYKSHVRDAKLVLGEMFIAEDYPKPETIRDKFFVKVKVLPVPEAGDFRAKISNKDTATIVKDLERLNRESLQRATQAVYERIVEVTERMFDRLSKYVPSPGAYTEGAQNTFKDTLVSNVKEVADLIPVLNLTDDPRLEELRVRMVRDLTAYEPDELRSNDGEARRKTAKAAGEILKKARAFIA